MIKCAWGNNLYIKIKDFVFLSMFGQFKRRFTVYTSSSVMNIRKQGGYIHDIYHYYGCYYGRGHGRNGLVLSDYG